VSINAESGGQPVTNVIGVRKPFSTSEEITETVLAAWIATNGPRTRQQSTTVLKDIRAMFLGVEDGEVYVRPATGGGVLTDQKSTNAACALISIGGTSRARTSKGRLYFGPLGEPQIESDGRTVTAAYRTSLQASFVQFDDQLAADGMEWVVVSRKLQDVTPVTQIAVQSTIATQRRRIR
jgi:hypothetical protein